MATRNKKHCHDDHHDHDSDDSDYDFDHDHDHDSDHDHDHDSDHDSDHHSEITEKCGICGIDLKGKMKFYRALGENQKVENLLSLTCDQCKDHSDGNFISN